MVNTAKLRGMLANEVFRRAHPEVTFFPPDLRRIVKQGLTIGEFLRVELVVKRGLNIYSAMSEQEVEELPFQPVSPIQPL